MRATARTRWGGRGGYIGAQARAGGGAVGHSRSGREHARQRAARRGGEDGRGNPASTSYEAGGTRRRVSFDGRIWPLVGAIRAVDGHFRASQSHYGQTPRGGMPAAGTPPRSMFYPVLLVARGASLLQVDELIGLLTLVGIEPHLVDERAPIDALCIL